MKYLQACELVKNSNYTDRKSLLLASSGQTENLDIYLRAEFAVQEVDCHVSHIAFNTLEQQLIVRPEGFDLQAVVLMPWDFLPFLDWRIEPGPVKPDTDACLERIEKFARLLRQQPSYYSFVQAPVPPRFGDSKKQEYINTWIYYFAIETCQTFHESSVFNLDSYQEYGVPFSGKSCGRIASTIAAPINSRQPVHHKIVASDLDNVMWRGIIGEKGVEGIQHSPRGDGYLHFLYQGFLKKIKNAGILLAAVSKNDPDLARIPFTDQEMVLNDNDLVTIQASYYAKSAQIKNIADSLNLPIDSFVFIDDNPIEIEEVQNALPDVSTVLFPSNITELPRFLNQLSSYFDLRGTTIEDKNRTSLYKTRLLGMVPSNHRGSDLSDYLKDLSMKVQIRNQSDGDNERALQLFNKTNQFNINGYRISRAELDEKLSNGYSLFTVAVSDRYGEHGEVLACLLDENSNIEMLVLSCRVFQRKIEHFFLLSIAKFLQTRNLREIDLNYKETDRNTPVKLFLEENNLHPQSNRISIDISEFIELNKSAEDLFNLSFEP